MSEIPLFLSPTRFAERTAIVEKGGAHTYEWLETRSRLRAQQLLGGRPDLREARVAFLMEPGFEYVVTQ